jgi:hypothetical protein
MQRSETPFDALNQALELLDFWQILWIEFGVFKHFLKLFL